MGEIQRRPDDRDSELAEHECDGERGGELEHDRVCDLTCQHQHDRSRRGSRGGLTILRLRSQRLYCFFDHRSRARVLGEEFRRGNVNDFRPGGVAQGGGSGGRPCTLEFFKSSGSGRQRANSLFRRRSQAIDSGGSIRIAASSAGRRDGRAVRLGADGGNSPCELRRGAFLPDRGFFRRISGHNRMEPEGWRSELLRSDVPGRQVRGEKTSPCQRQDCYSGAGLGNGSPGDDGQR